MKYIRTQHDVGWNPVVGCTKISLGCRNCFAMPYAMEMNGHTGPIACRTTRSFSRNVAIELDQVTVGSRVVASVIGDVFHERVTHSHIEWILSIIRSLPDLTFDLATRRPQRAMDYDIPSNAVFWFSVSTVVDMMLLSKAIESSGFRNIYRLGIGPIMELIPFDEIMLDLDQIELVSCTVEKHIDDVSNSGNDLSCDTRPFEKSIMDLDISRDLVLDSVRRCYLNDIDLYVDRDLLVECRAMVARWKEEDEKLQS